MSSKIRPAPDSMSRLALTTRGTSSLSVTLPSKHAMDPAISPGLAEPSLVGEFRGHGDGVHQGAVSEHRDLQPLVDRLLEQQPLEGLGVSQWCPIDREDQVPGLQSAERGGASGDDLNDPQGGALADPSRRFPRQRSGRRDKPEVATPNPTVMHERVDDPPRGGVDRDREP